MRKPLERRRTPSSKHRCILRPRRKKTLRSVVVVILMLLIGCELSAGVLAGGGEWNAKSSAKKVVDQGYRHVTESTLGASDSHIELFLSVSCRVLLYLCDGQPLRKTVQRDICGLPV